MRVLEITLFNHRPLEGQFSVVCVLLFGGCGGRRFRAGRKHNGVLDALFMGFSDHKRSVHPTPNPLPPSHGRYRTPTLRNNAEFFRIRCRAEL